MLEGWLSLPTAAEDLRVTRQRVFQMGAEEGKLTSLRQVPGAGERPAAYVVGEAEVCKLRRTQLEAAIKAAQDDDSEESAAQIAHLREQLAAVQLDAVKLLFVQLGASADAAEVAGDADLAKLLRRRAANMQVPVGT